MASWLTPNRYGVGDLTSVSRFDSELLDNINLLAVHTHTGSAGDGKTLNQSSVSPAAMRYISIPALMPASLISASHVTGNEYRTIGGEYYNGFLALSGPGASAKYIFDLDSGTWTLNIISSIDDLNAKISGSITACFNGSAIATNDYTTCLMSGSFSLSSSGRYILKVEVTAVSGCGNIQHIELRRLSA